MERKQSETVVPEAMADADAESVTGKRAVEAGAGGGQAGSEPEAKRTKAESEDAVDALANRPATKAKLEWLYQTGKVNKGEIAQSTLLQLSEVSDSRGVEIVEQFSESDLSDVPDKSSFFSGVIKCFRSPYSAGTRYGLACIVILCSVSASVFGASRRVSHERARSASWKVVGASCPPVCQVILKGAAWQCSCTGCCTDVIVSRCARRWHVAVC